MTTFRRNFAIAALLLAPSASVMGQSPASIVPATIVASGQGESKIFPDRASVLVSIQTRAVTASVAGSENAQRTRAVLEALRTLGLPQDQLVTEGYSVYPEMKYDKDGGVPRVVAYVVTNSVRAETRRTEQAGTIVDAALAAGASTISNLSFYASSIEEARRLAISGAFASARADADAMARAAGGAVGALVELSTSGPTVPPRPMYDMSVRGKAMGVSEPTPITPGPQTVTVFVNARWHFLANP